MGTLLSIARQDPLPISYLTTGQNVPDDIEPANPPTGSPGWFSDTREL